MLTIWSCKSKIPSEKIEYIDFSYSRGLNNYSLKIIRDSCFASLFLDDSIGWGCGKFDKSILDSIKLISDAIIGNINDTKYTICDSHSEYYQLIIKRTNSKITYFGGNCKGNKGFDKIKDILHGYLNKGKIQKGRKIQNFESEISTTLKQQLKS